MNASYLLRIEWPIHDPAMWGAEAIQLARPQVAVYAEEHQVTLLGTPHLRVVGLPAERQAELDATRVVVCEVPVRRRLAVAS